MKALASTDSFLGLPEQGKFATERVRRSFLIMRVMPERLTRKPSLFKVLGIPAGWRPWLWSSLISHVVGIFRHGYHLSAKKQMNRESGLLGVAMAANNAGHTRSLESQWEMS